MREQLQEERKQAERETACCTEGPACCNWEEPQGFHSQCPVQGRSAWHAALRNKTWENYLILSLLLTHQILSINLHEQMVSSLLSQVYSLEEVQRVAVWTLLLGQSSFKHLSWVPCQFGYMNIFCVVFRGNTATTALKAAGVTGVFGNPPRSPVTCVSHPYPFGLWQAQLTADLENS